MFKSKEVNESRLLNNTTLPRLNETCNGALPKITLTPLNSHITASRKNKVLSSPPIGRQGTPRRYSLSEASPSTSRTNANVSPSNSPGPLLASLSFKDNVSMYEETRSSGLAKRIVLYNEEAEQDRHPTHQEKYNRPGLFPIVNLFKQKPPLLEQSPNRVKIKISSPEYLRSYSPQHRNKVLEGITKPRLQRQLSLPSHGPAQHTSTKSVLEALKEISRKRIHSNEEHDNLEDSGKRIRTDLPNDSPATTSKRTRADSPLLDSSGSPVPKQSQKKLCVYDEFAASKSSSDFSFLTKSEPLRSKRKTTSTSTESLTDTKQVKLVNAETQTITAVSESKTKPPSDETDNEKSSQKECFIKVFDDAPLDRIRKSRLAALMGNLAGKDAAIPLIPITEPVLKNKSNEPEEPLEVLKEQSVEEAIISLPPPTEEKPKETESVSHEKPLVSILSPPRSTKESSPLRLDRHVQFSVTANSNPIFSQPSLTQTSDSIVTPIVSDSISKSPSVTGIAFPISSSVNSVVPPNVIPSFSFGTLVSSKSETNSGNTLLSSASSITSSSSPSFSFSKPSQPSVTDMSSTEKLPVTMSSTFSPQKSGGFKFDLKTPTSLTPPTTTKPILSFPSPPSTTSAVSTMVSSPTFSFGKPTESRKDSTFSFGPSNPTAVKTSAPEPAFAFGGLSKAQTFNFGPTVTTTAELKLQTSNAPGGFSFGSNINGPKFGNLESAGQASAVAAFGSLPSGSTTSASNVGRSSPFSITTTTSGGFGAGVPTFGVPIVSDVQNISKAAPTFSFGGNTAAVTTASLFSIKPNVAFGASTTSSTISSFGQSVTSSSFGSNNPATNLTFSTPTTSTPVFGGTSGPVFGNTQVTKASVFGSTMTSTPSVFGGTSNNVLPTGFGPTDVSKIASFKPPTSTSAYGSAQSAFGSNPTTAASVFRSVDTKSATFGSSNVFGATGQAPPAFGSNTAGAFGGATQSQSVFGSSTTSTPNPPPPYGSSAFSSPVTTTASTASAFGTSNPAPTFSFGSNKPASASPFGVSITTAASSTFGTSSAFSSVGGGFNANSGFGSSTPSFGNSASVSSTFGAKSTPAFSQASENKAAFGQTSENKPGFAFGASENKPPSGFGSGAGNSAFGKPTNTQGGFGSSTSSFGSTNTSGFSSQQTNGGFNFGSNTSSTSAAPFAFGGAPNSNEPAKPSFNFTGGTTNPPAFGANATAPAFGAPAPNFGGSAPAFGATGSPATGVFTIGAGSASTGRPRTQLRAKRRT